MLSIVDEFTRECLAIDVARRLNSQDVLAQLGELCVQRAVPEHIRSDNGPEFAAKAVRHWLERVGVQTLFIEPRSPWETLAEAPDLALIERKLPEATRDPRLGHTSRRRVLRPDVACAGRFGARLSLGSSD